MKKVCCIAGCLRSIASIFLQYWFFIDRMQKLLFIWGPIIYKLSKGRTMKCRILTRKTKCTQCPVALDVRVRCQSTRWRSCDDRPSYRGSGWACSPLFSPKVYFIVPTTQKKNNAFYYCHISWQFAICFLGMNMLSRNQKINTYSTFQV